MECKHDPDILKVQIMNADAVGYLLLGYVSSIRRESKPIEETFVQASSAEESIIRYCFIRL